MMVEKQGIVDKLVPYATDLGVAFVYSEGFVSEYGVELSNKAAQLEYECDDEDEIGYKKRRAAHVYVLSDFDASGVNIGLNVEHAKRIGIDLQTVLDLGLQIDKVDERGLDKHGKPTSHWRSLEKKVMEGGKSKKHRFLSVEQEKFYKPYLLTEVDYKGGKISYLEFLKNRRIELNKILNDVKPRRFWEWLKAKMLVLEPCRNYNRPIEVPDYLVPTELVKLQNVVEKKTRDVLSSHVYKEWIKLSKYKGFVNVKTKEKEIIGTLSTYVNDKNIPILKDIEKLVEKYKSEDEFIG